MNRGKLFNLPLCQKFSNCFILETNGNNRNIALNNANRKLNLMHERGTILKVLQQKCRFYGKVWLPPYRNPPTRKLNDNWLQILKGASKYDIFNFFMCICLQYNNSIQCNNILKS